MSQDYELFEGKSLSSLFKDIYDYSKHNKKQLEVLVGEVLFGSGIFGVNVIGNLTSIINKFGESGFAGLVALLVLVGLFRK